MKSNALLISTLITLLITSLASHAQNDQSGQINIKVDLVSLGSDLKGLTLGRDKKPIVALAFRYDQTRRYRGSRVIEISQPSSARQPDPVDLEKHPDAIIPLPQQMIPNNGTGTEAKQKDNIAKAIAKRRERNPDLVALAVTPIGARHVTILLTPAADDTYRTHVINDNPTQFPFGRMRVHNFCRHPISMRFNNAKDIVIPSQRTRMTAPKKNSQLIYRLSYPKSNKWKVQENNIIKIRPVEQVQMIVLQSRAGFFTSSSGSRGGRLQVAILRRNRTLKAPVPSDPSENDNKPSLPDGRAGTTP